MSKLIIAHVFFYLSLAHIKKEDSLEANFCVIQKSTRHTFSSFVPFVFYTLVSDCISLRIAKLYIWSRTLCVRRFYKFIAWSVWLQLVEFYLSSLDPSAKSTNDRHPNTYDNHCYWCDDYTVLLVACVAHATAQASGFTLYTTRYWLSSGFRSMSAHIHCYSRRTRAGYLRQVISGSLADSILCYLSANTSDYTSTETAVR